MEIAQQVFSNTNHQTWNL